MSLGRVALRIQPSYAMAPSSTFHAKRMGEKIRKESFKARVSSLTPFSARGLSSLEAIEDSSSCVEVVNSKPELLACAAHWNAFRSRIFAWVDAGVAREDKLQNGFPGAQATDRMDLYMHRCCMSLYHLNEYRS